MKPILFEPVDSPYLVPFTGTFSLGDMQTRPPQDAPEKKKAKAELRAHVEQIGELQRKLYAHDSYSVLLVFQALDAAGKDGTIRAVMTGVNPAGCQVFSFKRPSEEELDHDFMWRIYRSLPERGRIGIFNRSHYEEVVAVRVNASYLAKQRLPRLEPSSVWAERFDSIRDIERHLARNGTVILKFYLNVSKQEQKKRLLARIDEPESNWKFRAEDLETRAHWKAHLDAYEEALQETSRPWAPWYAVPADSKSYLRLVVASIVRRTLEQLPIDYPRLDDEARANLVRFRDQLTTD